jgi:hypothetical protein
MDVEDLEREAGGAPRLRLVGADVEPAHPLPTRGWWIGMTAAAAAILAMAAALPLMMGAPARPDPAVATGDKTPAPVDVAVVEPRPTPPAPVAAPIVDAGSVERCVVVAIYRNKSGGLDCVTAPSQQVWQGNKCLSEVSAQELKTLTIERPCPKDSDHALVVAMAGPQRSLPKTESDAVGLAACILGGQDDGRALNIASAAAGCVPPEVSVKIESIGSR